MLNYQRVAVENGTFTIEIVDLPINFMVDLSIVFCMFTRGFPEMLVPQ